MIFNKYNGTEQFYEMDNSYTKIAAKAFLSCKSIHEIVLSDELVEIGNWAFAHMHNLERIWIPANPFHISKDTFLDCPRLSDIYIKNISFEIDGISKIIASVINGLECSRLFTPEAFSSEQECEAWLQEYDKELVQYLQRPDRNGFEPVLIGWFDDEGEETQLPKYLNKVRKNKAKLVFLRLKYDTYLNNSTRVYLYQYLRDHLPMDTFDMPEHLGVWDLLGTEYGRDIKHIQILKNAGILNNSFAMKLMDYLNEKEPDTEVIAYLLSLQQINRSDGKNILDELDL